MIYVPGAASVYLTARPDTSTRHTTPAPRRRQRSQPAAATGVPRALRRRESAELTVPASQRRHGFLSDSIHRFTDLPLVRRGKVRDVYALGDARLLIVATDRISAFDHVLAAASPARARAHAAVRLLVRPRRRPGAPSPDDHRRRASPPCSRRTPTCSRPLDAGAAADAVLDRMRRARLPVRLRLEGISGDGQSAASRCRPACGRAISCPSRSSLPPPRRRAATTRTSARARGGHRRPPRSPASRR